jgi:vitamin B12 transporter
MKKLGTILLCLMAFSLAGQTTFSDTVKLKSVLIQGNKHQHHQEQLDSAVLSDPQHLNLGDLLSKKSHLFIKSYGIGSLATISLRGSGSSHTQLNWNGISLNSSMNGSSDLALFPLFFMDEVTLNYGLNSSADGTGGIGGAVNISTVPRFKKQLNLYVSANYGSYGQRQYNARIKAGNEKFQSITKIIRNTADNNFNYKDLTQEGFPQRTVKNASFTQKGMMQNFFFKLKKNQLLEANLWWFESERNLPPLITLRDNTELQKDIALKSLVKYSKYFNNGTLKITTAYIDDALDYVNERANIQSNSHSKSLRTRADYEFNWKKIKFHSQVKYNNNRAVADGLSDNVSQNRIEAYTKVKRKISENFSVNVSTRYLNVLKDGSYFLPQLRVEYQNKKQNSRLFAVVGRNVKYPNLNDLYFHPSGNVNLKAEESESVEIGGSLGKSLFRKKLDVNGSATVFYNNIQNYIQWEPTAFGFWKPSNLSSVETMGFELFAELSQQKGTIKKHFSSTYSFTSSKNFEKQHEFDESKGKQLIYIPEHKGNVSLELEFKGIVFSTNYQVIGIRYISSDNEEFLPTYSLLDFGMSRRFSLKQKNSVEISVGIKNTLDTEYQSIEWRPMPNRNYFIKIGYQFKT